MKTLFTLTFFLSFSTCFSQNYQTVYSNMRNHYVYNNYKNVIESTKIDSIRIEGSDSVFYNFKIVAEPDTILPYYCQYKINSNSFLGNKVIIRDGLNLFFNKGLDTIHIKTNQPQNASWRVFNLPGKNYIEGEVTMIALENVLGITDTVKSIILRAKDSLGLNISHALNGKILKIGKILAEKSVKACFSSKK